MKRKLLRTSSVSHHGVVSGALLVGACFIGFCSSVEGQDTAPSTAEQVRIRYDFTPLKQFGLEAKTFDGNEWRWRRLSYSAKGSTNVTLLKINGTDVLLGRSSVDGQPKEIISQ